MTEEKTIVILHVPSVVGPAKPGPRFFLRLMDRDRGRMLIEVEVREDIEVTQEHIKDGHVVTKHLGRMMRLQPTQAPDGPDPAKPAEHPAGSAAHPGTTKDAPPPTEPPPPPPEDDEDKKHGKGGKHK